MEESWDYIRFQVAGRVQHMPTMCLFTLLSTTDLFQGSTIQQNLWETDSMLKESFKNISDPVFSNYSILGGHSVKLRWEQICLICPNVLCKYQSQCCMISAWTQNSVLDTFPSPTPCERQCWLSQHFNNTTYLLIEQDAYTIQSKPSHSWRRGERLQLEKVKIIIILELGTSFFGSFFSNHISFNIAILSGLL